MACFAVSFSGMNGQHLEKNAQYYMSTIGFWNVENLYDTLNDKWKNDEDFTPSGVNAWNGMRYLTKLDRLGEVIHLMGLDVSPDGLSILGLCEIENKKVLQDLVLSSRISDRNYQFVHVEGPDARGIDPALIYNPRYFKLKNALAYPVKMVTDSNYKTRNVLVVSGLYLGEPFAVMVNHWPSRRGGELTSRPNRNAAARVVRKIADSIASVDPNMKIIIMGDFNDDPVNESVKKIIGTYDRVGAANDKLYFNPMEEPCKKGIGSLAWQDSWNLFDQVLLNKNWISGKNNSWQYHDVRIYNKTFLKADHGNYRGYPFRTYSGGTYTGGYSDHFPAYIIIAKKKE